MEKEYDKSGRYPREDLVGRLFERLTILGWVGRNKQGDNMWLCRCSCGVEKFVRHQHLKSGRIKSCGCLRAENRFKHGYASHTEGHHPLYVRFQDMKSRCYNKNDIGYKNYGDRGIDVCDEWLKSPKTFIEWGLKNGFEEYLTIERIDNNKGYSPENCCFATPEEQSYNKRTNHLITYNGKTQTVAQWAKEFNLKWTTLKERIKRGWSVKDALLRPVKYKKKIKQ